MTTEVAAGYIVAKTASAVGGLFGGLTMFAFMKPHTSMDATVRGGICTGSAIIGAPVFCEYINMIGTVEHLVFCGAVIGFLAWGVLSMIARFFIKAETANKDIVEAVKEIKN